MTERIRYNRPKGQSSQYEYGEKDAVRDQEEARRRQVKQEAARVILETLDATLEAIDEIIDEVRGEETVEEWVNNFQQQGGE